jgi:hypothetical protein
MHGSIPSVFCGLQSEEAFQVVLLGHSAKLLADRKRTKTELVACEFSQQHLVMDSTTHDVTREGAKQWLLRLHPRSRQMPIYQFIICHVMSVMKKKVDKPLISLRLMIEFDAGKGYCDGTHHLSVPTKLHHP